MKWLDLHQLRLHLNQIRGIMLRTNLERAVSTCSSKVGRSRQRTWSQNAIGFEGFTAAVEFDKNHSLNRCQLFRRRSLQYYRLGPSGYNSKSLVYIMEHAPI